MRRAVAVALAGLVPAVLASTAGAASPVPGYLGCRSFVSGTARAIVRPRSIVFACGDGNFYAVRLHWSRWDARAAAGAGVAYQNDCTPTCAAGHFHAYRIATRLSGARSCGSPRRLEFTRASWTFVGRKPVGVRRSGTETFRCR